MKNITWMSKKTAEEFKKFDIEQKTWMLRRTLLFSQDSILIPADLKRDYRTNPLTPEECFIIRKEDERPDKH